MGLSLAAALQLQVFSTVPLRIYAGERHLNRDVRYAHPVEISDVAQFLTGGELLLTAGLGLGPTAAEQRRFVHEVSAAGAAGLIVELSGRAFSVMPTALISAAEELGFPLVGLGGEVAFAEVSAQIHELLDDANNADLIAFERLNAEFIGLLLARRTVVSFAEQLAHHVGSPVVLEDADHTVVAYAGGTADTDQMMRNWGLHARTGHQGADDSRRAAPSPKPDDQLGCVRRIVVLRGEAWGWLHIFHGQRPLNGVDSYALDRAADAIAITLQGDRESGARASQRQNSLIHRLLLGDLTGEQFVSRALRIGRDLRDRPLSVVVLRKTGDAEPAEAALRALIEPLRIPAVLADTGNDVLAIVGLSPQVSSRDLADHLDQRHACAGVSRSCGPAGLLDATRQARAAASVAGSQDRTALHFDHLGVLRLLVALADGPELGRYVDDELAPVLAHDKRQPNVLLPTLRAYLACDANKSRAAEVLFVQRRTLYYRLERLEALLGRPLDDPQTRSGLTLALQALDFMNSTSVDLVTAAARP